jgi:hypothetical protein
MVLLFGKTTAKPLLPIGSAINSYCIYKNNTSAVGGIFVSNSQIIMAKQIGDPKPKVVRKVRTGSGNKLRSTKNGTEVGSSGSDHKSRNII